MRLGRLLIHCHSEGQLECTAFPDDVTPPDSVVVTVSATADDTEAEDQSVVIFSITGLPDNSGRPFFGQASYPHNLTVEHGGEESCVTVSASGGDGAITYAKVSVEPESMDAYFEVQDNGEVDCLSFDGEVPPETILLTVKATSTGGGGETTEDESVVVFTVVDLPSRPYFEQSSYPTDLEADHDDGVMCAEVAAQGATGITYSKVSVDPVELEDLFQVDGTTGQVTCSEFTNLLLVPSQIFLTVTADAGKSKAMLSLS